MRTMFLIATAAIAGGLAFVTPTAARDYPWCRLGNQDCMYSTYAQCMAALSGTVGDCRQNPLLLATTPQTEPLRAYGAVRRHHHHRHHVRRHHHREHHHGHRHHHRG